VVLTQYRRVADGQTDGQTDRQTDGIAVASTALAMRALRRAVKTVRPMLSNRCLACLSVTLVYYGQTVGWIKMPLGTEVGLGPGHIVLDGHPALLMERGIAAPTFVVYRRRQTCVHKSRGPCLLWPNSWMNQDTFGTDIGIGPGDVYCTRWGLSSPT